MSDELIPAFSLRDFLESSQNVNHDNDNVGNNNNDDNDDNDDMDDDGADDDADNIYRQLFESEMDFEDSGYFDLRDEVDLRRRQLRDEDAGVERSDRTMGKNHMKSA